MVGCVSVHVSATFYNLFRIWLQQMLISSTLIILQDSTKVALTLFDLSDQQCKVSKVFSL